jgi:hypothetical protein
MDRRNAARDHRFPTNRSRLVPGPTETFRNVDGSRRDVPGLSLGGPGWLGDVLVCPLNGLVSRRSVPESVKNVASFDEYVVVTSQYMLGSSFAGPNCPLLSSFFSKAEPACHPERSARQRA